MSASAAAAAEERRDVGEAGEWWELSRSSPPSSEIAATPTSGATPSEPVANRWPSCALRSVCQACTGSFRRSNHRVLRRVPGEESPSP